MGSFYRPPSDNITSIESFDRSLQQVKATIIVEGDYNAGDIDWDLCHVNTNPNKNLICQKLIDIFNEYGLNQLQKLPTRGEAILDLFATNKPNLVKSITNIPGLSYGHDGLAIDMDVLAQVSKKPSCKIYKWSKADWEGIKMTLTSSVTLIYPRRWRKQLGTITQPLNPILRMSWISMSPVKWAVPEQTSPV